MNLNQLLSQLVTALSGLVIVLNSFLSVTPRNVNPPVPILTVQGAVAKGLLPKQPVKFGAVGNVDSIVAYFETYLQAGITSNATSMTLFSATTTANLAVAAGTYGFVLDQGTPSQEVVRGTLSGLSVTAMTRGIDPQNPNATSSVLQVPHSRGADIKITDYPILGQLVRLLQGSDTLPSTLVYQNHPTCGSSASTTIPDYNCVVSVATSGAPVAGLAAKGLVAITTPLGATSTADGIGFDFNVIPAVYYSATSSATTTVVMTNGAGTIPTPFIAQNSTTTYSFLGDVTHASTTYTGTSTFNGSVIFNSKVNFTSSTITGLSSNNLVDASTTVQNVFSSTATTTVMSVTIPANTISGTSNFIKTQLLFNQFDPVNNLEYITITFGTSTVASVTSSAASACSKSVVDCSAEFEFDIMSNGNSTSSQFVTGKLLVSGPSTSTQYTMFRGTTSATTTLAQTLQVQITNGANSPSVGFNMLEYNVRKYQL